MSLTYHLYLFFGYKKAEIDKEQFQYLKTVKLEICHRRKSQLVLCQVVTNPCCGVLVIFCVFISHLIGYKTINIPEIFSGVHGFMGKTVLKYYQSSKFHWIPPSSPSFLKIRAFILKVHKFYGDNHFCN